MLKGTSHLILKPNESPVGQTKLKTYRDHIIHKTIVSVDHQCPNFFAIYSYDCLKSTLVDSSKIARRVNDGKNLHVKKLN